MSYDFIITLIRRGKKPLFSFENWMVLIVKSWVSFTPGCFVPSLVEIGPAALKTKIIICRQCIFAISLLSQPGKGYGPSFEHTWIPVTQGCSVSILVEIGSVVLEKKIFKFCIWLFRNYLPLEKGMALHFNKLKFPSWRMLCTKFGWN